MLLYPPEPDIGPKDGFTSDNDIFGLREFGESLTNLVTTVEQPLVMTLDGPWGSGKSTFAKQWAGELRKLGLPVILFDAFANDHQEDAFVALSAEILAQAEKLKGPKKLRDEFKKKATKAGRALLPVATKIGIRAATLGLLSAKDLEGIGEDIEEALKEASVDTGALLESVIHERLEQAKEDKDSLEAFRKALTDLATGLATKTKKGAKNDAEKSEDSDNHISGQRPLVFIIDELDRCRPPFALNILERIKHIFSVDGVCFLLVTNLEQLEATVRGAYGRDTAARAYLDKFSHLRVRLPERTSERHSRERRDRYIDHLWTSMGLKSADQQGDEETTEILKILAKVHDLSLRDLERIAGHIALVYAAVTQRHTILVPFLGVLSVMRLVRRDLYKKAGNGQLAQADVQEFLALNLWDGDHAADWVSEWWQFAIDPNSIEEQKAANYQKLLIQSGLRSKGLLPMIVRLMDQFHRAGE
jgi:hypothetical protein